MSTGTRLPARIRVTLGCMEDILHRPHHTSVMDARTLRPTVLSYLPP
jgi:hypothetical protein